MKRLILSITLVFCTIAAHSQIFVSLNAGGSISSGNTITTTRVTISTDSTLTTSTPHVGTTTLGAGFRFGYKTGKVMFGIGANYSTSTLNNQPLDSSLIPIYPAHLWSTNGSMSTKSNTITIAPFLRFDIVKAGDISLFLELNGFYSMEQNPTVTAHQIYTAENPTTHSPEKLREFDTTFTQTRNTTGFGARLTPGLNWMITPNISLDLYLDFLSLAYSSYSRTSESYQFAFKLNNMGNAVNYAETLTTTVTEKSTDIDLGIFGTPDWSSPTPKNFVRVGINICF